MADNLCFTGSLLLFLLMALASIYIPSEKWLRRVAYALIMIGVGIGILSVALTYYKGK